MSISALQIQNTALINLTWLQEIRMHGKDNLMQNIRRESKLFVTKEIAPVSFNPSSLSLLGTGGSGSFVASVISGTAGIFGLSTPSSSMFSLYGTWGGSAGGETGRRLSWIAWGKEITGDSSKDRRRRKQLEERRLHAVVIFQCQLSTNYRVVLTVALDNLHLSGACKKNLGTNGAL